MDESNTLRLAEILPPKSPSDRKKGLERTADRARSPDYNPAMGLRFIKMHGIGNDYVYVDGFSSDVADAPSLARRVADRHRGVGGDGLIIIQPPESRANDCRMEMYNADGSRAEMCGNGIRCVGKFVHDEGIATKSQLAVETDAGLKTLHIERDSGGRAEHITVDMGAPGLRRADLPMVDGGDPESLALEVPLEVAGHRFHLTGVSMGNPHAICRADRIEALSGDVAPSLAELPLHVLGPAIEHHAWFPERVNTEFVVPRALAETGRSALDFRVWERGSGETQACGTGACAAVVAGALGGWCERRATVHLLGGDLRIEWSGEGRDGTVLMTGSATEVFRGELTEEH